MSDEMGARQKIMIGVIVVAFGAAVYLLWRNLAEDPVVASSRTRWFVCAKTGKAYKATPDEGAQSPYYSPHSDANTGYLAELCYWTKDANGEWSAKLDPTPVLLMSIFERDAVTTCPDCGHEVVAHNKKPPRELMQAAGS